MVHCHFQLYYWQSGGRHDSVKVNSLFMVISSSLSVSPFTIVIYSLPTVSWTLSDVLGELLYSGMVSPIVYPEGMNPMKSSVCTILSSAVKESWRREIIDQTIGFPDRVLNNSASNTIILNVGKKHINSINLLKNQFLKEITRTPY